MQEPWKVPTRLLYRPRPIKDFYRPRTNGFYSLYINFNNCCHRYLLRSGLFSKFLLNYDNKINLIIVKKQKKRAFFPFHAILIDLCSNWIGHRCWRRSNTGQTRLEFYRRDRETVQFERFPGIGHTRKYFFWIRKCLFDKEKVKLKNVFWRKSFYKKFKKKLKPKTKNNGFIMPMLQMSDDVKNNFFEILSPLYI